MYFINFRKKFTFLFLAFTIVLVSIISITFGTIGSAAFSNGNQERQQAKQAEELADSSVFDEFNSLVDSYVKTAGRNTFKSSDEQINRGANLAIKRRELLKQLMIADPKAALARAIPAEDFDKLPSFITENSEKRISAEGDFLVYAIEGNNQLSENASGKRGVKQQNGSRIERTVVIGEARYKAIVYGRRQTMTTKLDIPLQGIVVDDVMAVDETPARVINSAEYADQAARVNAPVLEDGETAAEIGGKAIRFSGQAGLDAFVGKQIEWESQIGPTRVGQSSAKDNSGEQTLAPEATTSTWTEGTKTILFIRVDFSDAPGDPVDHTSGQPLTQARAQNIFASEVNPFYVNNSYNKTSLQTTVTTLLRMPQTRSYYTQGENYNQLLADARTAAAAAGANYNPANFSFDMVGFTTSDLSFQGLGFIGLKGALLNGAFSAPEISHELGHNYGLFHANSWRAYDGSITGVQGNHIEYGDCFDTMAAGCNFGPQSHFNARYKRLLNWLTDTNVQTVTTNGTYPLYAQDSASPGGIRVLKINRDGTRDYWIEFRQMTNNSNVLNGAIIRWDSPTGDFSGTELLDMTPATYSKGDDEPLLTGKSFFDSSSEITITVLGKGNTTTPAESLNVKVEFTRSNCVYSLSSTSQQIGAAGGPFSIFVTVSGDNCSWSATPNDNWINISGGVNGGTESGTVSYNVATNITNSSREGTISIGGRTFTVTQAGGNGGGQGNCTYPPSSPNAGFGSSGGTGSFSISSNSDAGCLSTYTVTSNASWITVNNPSGLTSDIINYTVAPNTGATRTGILTISSPGVANQTFTVSQAPPPAKNKRIRIAF